MKLGSILFALSDRLGGTIRDEFSQPEFGWLLRPRDHIALLASRRTAIIVSRVRLVALLFAVLTPIWIFVDVATFPIEIWRVLVAARVAATLAFLAVVFRFKSADNPAEAYMALSALMAIPALFFLVSHGHMARFHLQGIQSAFALGYAFLPFVMVAGLSVFPLTLLESAAFAAPTVVAQLLVGAILWPDANWPQIAGIMWLLSLIAAVSTLAGLSQLAFMIVLVRDAIRDRMTGCFSRGSGEELIELQFLLAARINSPISVAFVDIDHFKQVNDRYGHEAGDHVLAEAAAQMRETLRSGDIVIRWGGEEFVLVMPNVRADQAFQAMQRLRMNGFGVNPDGGRITASIGIAERLDDASDTWKALVDRADACMYAAKQAGRDRVNCGSAFTEGKEAANEDAR